MHCAKVAILAFSIGVGFAAEGPPANLAAGKEIFHQNCSICHGVDAKGFRTKGTGTIYDPNSSEPGRRVPPSDLTVLTDHNGGVFPVDRLRQSVTTKGLIPAHGTPEMPAWGQVLDGLKSNPKRMEQQVRDLTAYIESVQQRGK